MSSNYGGQTSCGHPECRPDPDLIRKLDSHAALLEGLREAASHLHYVCCALPGQNEELPPGQHITACSRAHAVLAQAEGETECPA